MIAAVKSFLNPQTQEQMYRIVVGILSLALAVVFVSLLVSRYHDVRSSIYLSDGENVLKLSADNTITIYKSPR